MDAPTLPVSAEKNLGDPIEIRVDIFHPAPADVFPAATVVRTLAQHGEAIRGIHRHLQGVPINEEMNALRFRMGMAEEENVSLGGRIKTIEAIDTITRRQEKRARMELERQLASVQESQRQDQENFRKLQEFVTTMIDQTLLKNNTTDDGSQNSDGGPRRPMQPARVCSYTDFMKCQSLNFKGTEGVVGLSQWVEKMESVFHISGCAVENQVKFATCTLLGAALTWWNGHVRTLGHDTAYAMTWGNSQKEVDEKILSKRTKTLDDAIELANDLMDQKLCTYAERQAENKRKLDNKTQAQQQLLKKQNVVQAYAVGTGEKKPYGGSKPLCPKCNYHHGGECAPKNQGHYKSDCPMLKNQGTEAQGRVYALG
nr:hypothetical protein [Tanacetum cinerariifolium]